MDNSTEQSSSYKAHLRLRRNGKKFGLGFNLPAEQKDCLAFELERFTKKCEALIREDDSDEPKWVGLREALLAMIERRKAAGQTGPIPVKEFHGVTIVRSNRPAIVVNVTQQEFAEIQELVTDCQRGPDCWDDGRWREGMRRILGITDLPVTILKARIVDVVAERFATPSVRERYPLLFPHVSGRYVLPDECVPEDYEEDYS